MGRAGRPFEFIGCVELREMRGRAAWDERELLAGIEEVPSDSLRYHTRSYILRSRYLPAPYPSDFATWAAIQVQDRALGERLAVVDPFDFLDIELLRAELSAIIDRHLASLSAVPRVDSGEPFHFMRSVLIEVPTGVTASTLQEFREGLAQVDASAIYYHFCESVRQRPETDPLIWLEEIRLPEVAARVRQLDPFMSSLDGTRARLLAICDQAPSSADG